MTRREFERVVREALRGLPPGIQRRLENVAVVVEDFHSQDLLHEMGLNSPHDLLGLYQGVSLDRRGFFYGNVLPDRITLFKRPIEAQCHSRQELMETIQEVVLHEIGHYFGLDDEQLHRLLGEEGEEG